jgi:chlorophyll synthase
VTVGLLGTWIYSAPPLRTKRSTLGALFTIAIPRGVLVPVAGWSVIAAPSVSDPWALGLVAGLYVFGAAATKDFADVAGDEAHGCRTLPVVLGARRAARVVAPFLFIPFLLYPVLGALEWLHVPLGRLVVLGLALALSGGVTAFLLLRDPEGLAAGGKGHPAWIGMYLTLLASQVGSWIVYLT